MGLEQEVGQLFVPYVFGRSADDARPEVVAANTALLGVGTAAQAVSRWHLGGVLLLDHNPLDDAWPQQSTGGVDSPGTVARLTTGLQAAAAAAGDPPLLVAVDQEGGPVQRLGPPLTALPALMAYGAAGAAGPGLAESAARLTGGELRSLGVTLDLAPVADVATEPRNPVIAERSSGEDPAVVSAVVAAQVRGLRAAGVGSALKHFPGHGSTTVDSHLALPTVTGSRAELERVDLAPFRAGIAAGAPVVLLGELAVPALDPSLPSTVSPEVVRVLRQELGFRGVVVTDGLFMRALRGRYGDGELAVRALAAGADLLLQPAALPAQVAAVLAAVRSGRLPRARVDDAARRVLALKATYPPVAAPQLALDPGATGLLRSVAAASVTVVRDCAQRVGAGGAFRVVGSSPAAVLLAGALRRDGALDPAGTAVAVGPTPTGAPVLVGTAAPYALLIAPASAATLAAWSATPAQLQAAADVLAGRLRAVGTLPVTGTRPLCG